MTTKRAFARSERRGFGPLGFALAALLFLFLPAITASCSVPAIGGDASGSMSASLTGSGVVSGSRPDVTTSGILGPPSAETGESDAPDYLLDDGRAGIGARVVSIALLVALGFGILLLLLRWWRLRAILSLSIAAVAAALLVVGWFLVAGKWQDVLRDLGEAAAYTPQAQGGDSGQKAADAVSAGLGFWLSLAVLLAVVAVNAVLLMVRRPPEPVEPEAPPAT